MKVEDIPVSFEASKHVELDARIQTGNEAKKETYIPEKENESKRFHDIDLFLFLFIYSIVRLFASTHFIPLSLG